MSDSELSGNSGQLPDALPPAIEAALTRYAEDLACWVSLEGHEDIQLQRDIQTEYQGAEAVLRTAITTALEESRKAGFTAGCKFTRELHIEDVAEARREALEEAAKAADAHAAQCVAAYEWDDYYAGRQDAAEDIASAIRALATPERDTSDA